MPRYLALILISGILHAQETVIGMSAAFEGPSRGVGIELWRGSATYFEHVNRSGGLFGRKIRIVAYNDNYDPTQALKNTSTFVEKDNVFLLYGYMGTPTVTRVLPLLKIFQEKSVYLFFPFTGAQPLRSPPYGAYVFHLRASYQQETAGLVANLLSIGKTRIGVFYQNDAYGRSGWEGVRKALALRKLKIAADAAYLRGSPLDTNFSSQVSIFQAAKVDAIISVGAYAACAAFIRDARERGLHVPIANLSFVGSENMLDLLLAEGKRVGKDLTANLINSQVVPSYEDTSMPGVVEYRRLLDQYDPKPSFAKMDGMSIRYSFASFEGFLNAKLLVEILRRVGPTMERARLVPAAGSISNFDLGIRARASFRPAAHQALDQVYYTTVEKGEFLTIRSWDKWKK